MKILKLILLAAVLIGAIVVVANWDYIFPDKPNPPVPDIDVSSATAKEIKEQIQTLCQDGKWNAGGYASIESRIHTDSLNENIDMMEARSLRMYLYASSCSYVKEHTDKLFKQSAYAPASVSFLEAAVNLLKQKAAVQGSNSNLTEAGSLFSAYRQLLGALKQKASAVAYTRPLKAYSNADAKGRKARVQAMPYYQSHFSRNSSIKGQVARLGEDGGEHNYYAKLEQLVEQQYRRTHNLDQLLSDQIRFGEISTNAAATERLNQFVNNPNR